MKTKVFTVISILFFIGIIFCVESCKNDFLDEKNTTININLDLSKIVKTSRNLQENSGYILKLFVYDALTYKNDMKFEKLPLITQLSNKVDINGNIRASFEVQVGTYLILEAKLYEVINNTIQENPIYIGNSEVIKVKFVDNKIHLNLTKVQTDIDIEVEVEKENFFTVKFDSQGGSAVESKKIEKDSKAILPSEPTKTGYIFTGWYTSNDGGVTLDTEFNFQTPITSDITLYAKWTAIIYKVIFDKNNDNATGSMETQSFVYDTEQSLSEINFTLTGYRFTTWNTKTNGNGTIYNDQQKVKNLCIENDSTITLYAQWILEGNYSITYILDGGNNNSENPAYYNVESETITLKDPTKEGFIFDSWQDSTGANVTEIIKGSSGDITLTAKWIARTDISYKVEHYQQNIDDDEYTLFETESKTGTTNAETLATSKMYEGFNVQSFVQQTILGDGSTVVKIYYDRIKYTVSFINEEETAIQSVKYGGKIAELTDLTKEGYIFIGWYTSNDEGITFNTEFNFETPITSNVSLYAKWKLYTVIDDLKFCLPDNLTDVGIAIEKTDTEVIVTNSETSTNEGYYIYSENKFSMNASQNYKISIDVKLDVENELSFSLTDFLRNDVNLSKSAIVGTDWQTIEIETGTWQEDWNSQLVFYLDNISKIYLRNLKIESLDTNTLPLTDIGLCSVTNRTDSGFTIQIDEKKEWVGIVGQKAEYGKIYRVAFDVLSTNDVKFKFYGKISSEYSETGAMHQIYANQSSSYELYVLHMGSSSQNEYDFINLGFWDTEPATITISNFSVTEVEKSEMTMVPSVYLGFGWYGPFYEITPCVSGENYVTISIKSGESFISDSQGLYAITQETPPTSGLIWDGNYIDSRTLIKSDNSQNYELIIDEEGIRECIKNISGEEIVCKIWVNELYQVIVEEIEEISKSTNITLTTPSDWGNSVYAYFYADDQAVSDSWPGTVMISNGIDDNNQNIFTVAVPDGATHVVFNDGTNQTCDIPLNNRTHYTVGSQYETGKHYVLSLNQ